MCRGCGLVLKQKFHNSSYHFSEKSEPKSGAQYKQCVAMGERNDFAGSLGTFIDFEKSKYLKDKTGKLLPPDDQILFRRLKKNYAPFLRVKNHETEYRIFNILKKISIYLNLTRNTRINAGYYYRKIIKNEKKIINNITLIAFCIFYAMRDECHNAPVTISEVAQAFVDMGHRVNPRLILRDGLMYKKHLDNKVLHHKSEDYLNRLLNAVINYKSLEERLKKKKISLSKEEYLNELTPICRQILKNLNKWKRGGRNPFILTGAIIYLGAKILAKQLGEKMVLTQTIISEATKIPEYSIRDHYVNLLKPIFINQV